MKYNYTDLHLIPCSHQHEHGVSKNLLTEIWRTTGSLPSASCQPTATLLMSGTTVRLVDNVVVDDKEEEAAEEEEGELGTV